MKEQERTLISIRSVLTEPKSSPGWCDSRDLLRKIRGLDGCIQS